MDEDISKVDEDLLFNLGPPGSTASVCGKHKLFLRSMPSDPVGVSRLILGGSHVCYSLTPVRRVGLAILLHREGL